MVAGEETGAGTRTAATVLLVDNNRCWQATTPHRVGTTQLTLGQMEDKAHLQSMLQQMQA